MNTTYFAIAFVIAEFLEQQSPLLNCQKYLVVISMKTNTAGIHIYKNSHMKIINMKTTIMLIIMNMKNNTIPLKAMDQISSEENQWRECKTSANR